MEETKVCSRCKRELPKTEFHKASRSKDGLYTYCKECNTERLREWREKNRERSREYNRSYWKSYYKKNKDNRDEYIKKYNAALYELRRRHTEEFLEILHELQKEVVA